MQEGDVVLILGHLDDRVRNKTPNESRLGTVIHVSNEEVSVLLPNGDIWKGNRRDVVLNSEQNYEE